MKRLSRAPKRIAGVPITKQSGKDLAGAALDIVLGRAVGEEIAKERLDTCQNCELFNGSRCQACGCFMKTKVRLPTSHCPLHKWTR